jgi:hypothetical protein
MAKTATPTQATPRTTAAGSVPTPTQFENDQFLLAMSAGTLPHIVVHVWDKSEIDPASPDPSPPGPPTWPAP